MADQPPLRDYSRSRAVVIGTWEYEFLGRACRGAQHAPDGRAAHGTVVRVADRAAAAGGERARPGDLPDRLITAFDGISDVALFYYVGHGQISQDDQLCLGFKQSRTEANRRASTSLKFSDVRQALQESDAAVKIVILDCCFAGLATTRAGALAGSATC